MKDMKNQYYYFDIYPKVFLEEVPVTITIHSKSSKYLFDMDTEYTVVLRAYDEGNIRDYPERHNFRDIKVFPKNSKEIVFETTFSGEQQHSVVLYKQEQEIVELYLYSCTRI